MIDGIVGVDKAISSQSIVWLLWTLILIMENYNDKPDSPKERRTIFNPLSVDVILYPSLKFDLLQSSTPQRDRGGP